MSGSKVQPGIISLAVEEIFTSIGNVSYLNREKSQAVLILCNVNI